MAEDQQDGRGARDEEQFSYLFPRGERPISFFQQGWDLICVHPRYDV